MLLSNDCHLTYCTNIHPGESWVDHQRQLESHLPAIKKSVAPNEKLGIGLRLSALAGETLGKEENLLAFKRYLEENDYYVFTMNGFPYGKFHQSSVKDQVHLPDWQTRERAIYTRQLFTILQELVPEGLDGGISTSPLSYKPWFKTPEKLHSAMESALVNLVDTAVFLHKIKEEKGMLLHLDIEPEPDGILENSSEVVDFFNNWLLKKGRPQVAKILGISSSSAEEIIRTHIQLCFDVCHFALVYEEPDAVFQKFKEENIGIGKIQLSAALRTEIKKGQSSGKDELKQFEEDIYLHQVITRDRLGHIKSYSDLPHAFQACPSSFDGEWRVHFHVPLFIEQYGQLSSTQQQVAKTLEWVKKENRKVHLEVETYTWEVLPEPLKLDIDASIARELVWVKERI